VLLLKQTGKSEIASISTTDQDVEQMLNKEWLLTNDRGSFASSTILGCNTRRYHGLLVGALNPPVNRIVALSNCQEIIIKRKKQMPLSVFEFGGRSAAQTPIHLKRFRRNIGVHFDYVIDGFELTKSIYLHPQNDTVAIEYNFSKVSQEAEFIVRPLVALRDFHLLQNSYAHLHSVWLGDVLRIRHNIGRSCELFLRSQDMRFEHDRQWWFNFVYRMEKQRGQDFCEDLWTPGFFKCHIDKPRKIVLWATLTDGQENQPPEKMELTCVLEQLYSRSNRVFSNGNGKDQRVRALTLAAEQFIAKRQTDKNGTSTTILAGFHWFTDWGRDTFIALPGLLLATERFDQAKSVLTTFANAADDGMVPNRFDDYSHKPHYNSIDASLWFINAAFEYLYASRDKDTFTAILLPTIRWIIESYHKGTRFAIHADCDGLITGGNADTQLTWMDAKCDGIAFTPRYGKAVEVNALWYNALCSLAAFYRQTDNTQATHYDAMAEQVADSFAAAFWNDSASCLYDCILPDGTADAAIRPNQIFAVSLPFSPLSPQQQKQILQKIRQRLLTPYGLRTLDTDDSRYKGKYTGSQFQRDQAYHQGTVWPHLMGPFVEAHLRVNKFSKKSRKQALKLIEPLLQHLTETACIGSISEIFDGDQPHEPRGCIAQAWAVAELIRAYKLAHNQHYSPT